MDNHVVAPPGYLNLAYWHLATVMPAFMLGTLLMLSHKGTTRHKQLGKLYMVLMFGTAMITLGMPAQVGPVLLGHFGLIHLLSLQVATGVPLAWRAAHRGDLQTHRRNMIGIYVGGSLLAGSLRSVTRSLITSVAISLKHQQDCDRYGQHRPKKLHHP
jgi:uncharacterized membrane protein